MGKVLVIAEHRKGEIRDITLEMIWKGRALCNELGHTLTVALMGRGVAPFAEELAVGADEVLLIEDDTLDIFQYDLYLGIVKEVIAEETPAITLVGHTSWGMNLAPALACELNMPFATDCVDLLVEDDRVFALRQIYTGKINAKVSFRDGSPIMVTIRPGSFPAEPKEKAEGRVVRKEFGALKAERRQGFVEYAESPAGDVDITQAELLISVGRGIGEEENLPLVKELAEVLSGVLSCSRPIVDKNWLPKYLQVGTSGKSVQPKVYVAIGISGAFQHLAGIKGAGTVIAINKDPKAPIFREADYGMVGDLFDLVPVIKDKAVEMKG